MKTLFLTEKSMTRFTRPAGLDEGQLSTAAAMGREKGP